MSLMIEDIAAYLATESVGTVGTDIFVSHLPQSPDNGIVVMDTGGETVPQTDIERHDYQVLIRNTVYSTGQAKAELVLSTLDDAWWAASKYSRAHSLPIYLGASETGLHSWSINFTATL